MQFKLCFKDSFPLSDYDIANKISSTVLLSQSPSLYHGIKYSFVIEQKSLSFSLCVKEPYIKPTFRWCTFVCCVRFFIPSFICNVPYVVVHSVPMNPPKVLHNVCRLLSPSKNASMRSSSFCTFDAR